MITQSPVLNCRPRNRDKITTESIRKYRKMQRYCIIRRCLGDTIPNMKSPEIVSSGTYRHWSFWKSVEIYFHNFICVARRLEWWIARTFVADTCKYFMSIYLSMSTGVTIIGLGKLVRLALLRKILLHFSYVKS